MVLYGYDASTFNSVQASDNWLNWFGLTSDSTYLLGLINTVYSIGAIVSGWFLGGPIVSQTHIGSAQPPNSHKHQADFLGRRWGMGIGCFVTICATMIQTFSPKGSLGAFMAGRVLVGVGQGMALS